MPIQREAVEEWAYVSGRCASLEARLLGKDFFLELLRGQTSEEAHGRIAKSAYVELFPHPGALYGYDRLLRQNFRHSLYSLMAGSPPDGPIDIFLRGLELQETHELLIRQGIARATAEETERWAERLGAGFAWLSGFSVAAEARPLFAAHPVRALSLWVDGAYLVEMLTLASVRPGLQPYIHALVSFNALKVCWRAFRSEIDIGWLGNFFFRGPIPAPPMRELAAVAKDRSPMRLVRLLGPADFSLADEDFYESYGRESDDYLTRIARRGRHDVCGATRVLHYVRQLWVEHFNLNLCLSAVLTPIDAKQVYARLRSD